MKRKWMKGIGILLAAIIFCCGCQTAEKTEKTEKTHLTLWHYWDIKKNQENLQKLVDGFNNSQDAVEVDVTYVPDEDFKKQMALAMADGSTPDLAFVDSSDFQFLHSMQPFADLTDQIPEEKNYIDKAIKACTVDGKVYGLPFGVNCTGMFYNKKVLEENGCDVPTDWEKFRETARKVTSDSVNGFAITTLQTEESMYEFLPLFWSMGGDVYKINDAAGCQAFQFLNEMKKEGSLSGQSVSLTMGDLTNLFIQGKIAMMFNSSMAIDSIKENAPELEFGVAPIPCGENQTSVAGGEIIGVADNENKEASIQFLRYIADPDRMKEYIDDFGFLAPRQDVMDQQFADEPEKHAFIKMYENSRIRELNKNWPQISLTMADALKEVLLGDEDTQTILDQKAVKIESISGGAR